ncbi:MAG: class I SAM-dependent methyltransferase [Nitrospinae bacterium]|nr:class I SAM-dependent methyltransferase [Nitrospinota bacterium]
MFNSGYYRKEFDRIARFYDPAIRCISLFLGGEKRLRERVLKDADIRIGDKVLDIGCGTGSSSEIIAKKIGDKGRVIGLDMSTNMLKIAFSKSKSNNLFFIKANAENIPSLDNYFDKVHIAIVLHEMIYMGRSNTLKEIYRVLKHGGMLIAVDFNKPNGIFKNLIFNLIMLVETETARDMIKRTLKGEIEKAGFLIEKIDYMVNNFIQVIIAKKGEKG